MRLFGAWLITGSQRNRTSARSIEIAKYADVYLSLSREGIINLSDCDARRASIKRIRAYTIDVRRERESLNMIITITPMRSQ